MPRRKGEVRKDGVLLERARVASFTFDETEIAERVIDLFDAEMMNRSEERDRRLQRYAKYRMWTEGKDWPWAGSSDIALPDMMTGSLRVQDTLHNAVLSARPVVTSLALREADAKKQDTVDRLIDHQVFNEFDGEGLVGDLIESFVNDGTYFVYTPWTREKREVRQTKIFDPVPEDLFPTAYFAQLLSSEFRGAEVVSDKTNGWDFTVTLGDEKVRVSFYTADDKRTEMVVEKDTHVFDGPAPICKDYDDVLYPARAANLQMPSPSNPGGASWVTLRDTPTYDEIARLQKSGYYDRLTVDGLEELQGKHRSGADEQEDEQKDAIQGTTSDENRSVDPNAVAQGRVTRLICFDIYDIDGDGVAEDVIWWVIKETKQVVRARMLTDMYPALPPRRPIVSRALYPVKGRVAGIGMLEIMEGIHDALKEAYDTMADNDAIETLPFFFYRPFSGLKGTERMTVGPGIGIPLSDPKNDVHFPTRSNTGVASGLNKIAVLNQFQEKVTMVGDFQLGRVPQGKASALRTVGGMQMIAGQGEARPERILRRFFGGLTELWRQIKSLDDVFLPKDKEVRVVGVKDAKDSPFLRVKAIADILGSFAFIFNANVFNTSRMAMQKGLEALMGVYITDLAIQLGISTPDSVYRLLRDYGEAWGQDPTQYISEPVAGATQPRILAEEAIDVLLTGQMPVGVPGEPGGAIEHHQKLVAFMQMDEFGLMTNIELFRQYFQTIVQQAQMQMQQQSIMAGAQKFQQGKRGGAQGGRPPEQAPDMSQETLVSGGAELLDESLPSAGGGASLQ